jgi:ribosome-associated heat shock protein Hsp15
MSEQRLRLDKWLWYARFYKSRTVASGACAAGRIRFNGVRVGKPHHPLKAGDVLTFAQGPHIRVIRVRMIGARRGPASEARLLYEDLAPHVVSEPERQRAAESIIDWPEKPSAGCC